MLPIFTPAWTWQNSTDMPGAQKINGLLRRVPTWPLYVAGIAVPAWLVWLAGIGGLGVDPVKGLEHRLGELGLQVLIAGLAVTPIRSLTGVSLLKFRRVLGLVGFFFITLHFLTWLVLDVQLVGQIWADIVKRPYVTVGMAGFALLIPLAATSWNGAIRRIGAEGWRRLHRLVYPAVLLGGIHYVMLGKTWSPKALSYLAIILILLLLRARGATAPRRWAA